MARVALLGWAPIVADDARYVNVGLAVLDGRGAVTPDGRPFLLRSPVYGILLATPGRILGADPVDAARVVAFALAVTALVAATRLGWVLAGTAGAVGTAIALLATPLVWRLVPTLRIDLAQAAGILLALLALMRPTAPRWAAGGLVLGITILVKESALVLAVLPLAWLPNLPAGRWLRLAGTFWVVLGLVVGWWWLYVWLAAGVVFPFNALGVIEARDAGSALRPGASALVVALPALLGWAALVRRAASDVRARLVALAGAGVLPPAAYALLNGLDARNYAVLAVLSAVAIGAGLGPVILEIARRRGSRRLAAAGVIGLTAAITLGQVEAGQPTPSELPRRIADRLAERAAPGDRVVMPFREREVVALHLAADGRSGVIVVPLPIQPVAPTEAADAYIWLGLREGQLFGLRRDDWVRVVGDPATRFVVLVEPHPLTPAALRPALAAGAVEGVAPVGTEAEGGSTATIFQVEPQAASQGVAALDLHLDAPAALAWLDLAGPAAVERLLAVNPVIVGERRREALLERLGTSACSVPAPPPEPADAVRLEPCAPG